MYLKSIRAYGFKSFADKTFLEFIPGITGIVGPNGSGKSNVVDAIKWVLGEQSAKQLRSSGSISDVIFSGSKTRSGHTRAMVALTFDNSDHYLNSEFLEIEIKRVVYKTGENEYYLNNSKVRLKDITDLFLDSGANKESFNIISQGSVTDVVNSKPIERRSIFESAAGVLKYKKRKEESLKKLDRTKENLERIKLIANELKSSLNPLKEQAAIATKYLDFKTELEAIEIALIAHDICAMNEDYTKTKSEIEKLTTELATIDNSTTKDTIKIEKIKTEINKWEEKINNLNVKLFTLTENIADLSSKKQIMLERKKYKVDDISLQNNIVLLKEEELNLKKNLELLEKDIDILQANISKKSIQLDLKIKEVKEKSLIKNSLDEKIITKNKELYNLNNKIEILSDAIDNDTRLPYAVKCVLNNPRITGIHNIIGKLIEVDENNSIAIETALGYSANVIVVDNEAVAKNCINYLKDNKLGKATFFPLNIIKEKIILNDIIKRISQIDGYIDIASNLVKYDSKYTNIIKNQLGNVIVVKNIDTMNLIGRIIEYKYRIVTIDGEILHPGGSVTGGSNKVASGVINQKFEIDRLQIELQNIKNQINEYEQNLKIENEELNILKDQELEINKELIDLKEQLNRKNISYQDTKNLYNAKTNELKGTNATANNKLDKEIETILENYSKKTIEKEILEKEINNLKNDKIKLTDELDNIESLNRKVNSDYNKKQNELKNHEINLGKMDVKLDNLLNILSQNYNMTYDKAKELYHLDIELDKARLKVNNLKLEIKKLGEVNTGSIAEFERINKRYTFLTNQQNDLETSVNSLLSVIEEMDEIMKQRFQKTFESIKKEYAIVFEKLFKGGQGILKLTDPDNLLETGIEIIAMPPGKKLNSINLLSGGEKTLTAIALLFAILNVKPAPFCILDEVEAALDEANVDTFCRYLKEKNKLSQFVIITHKKKTMEYADVLYGITMQESGVSKLVSVELESLK